MSAYPSPLRLSLPTAGEQAATSPDRAIESLQEEILTLQDEISHLRRRDETLKYHMHRLDEELRLAARLQRDFLPKKLPSVGPVRFNVLFRPAGYVSGDIYDVFRLDETHVGFYVADAVGHGIPAALLTMFVKSALVTKEILPNGYRLLPPSQTLGQLNQALVEQGLAYTTFATALYGMIDTESLECTFARGGHPSPILVTAGGELRTLDADGGLLGIFPHDTYTDAKVQLSCGDRLFIYSDGIEVCLCDEGTDPAEWQQRLVEMRSLSTPELLGELSRGIDSAVGSLMPKDDLTIMVMEIQ
ncbi:MAG TPA: PP2C family protein-serine/threonine phosphatase [Tepidisphaeraceae bacterium]|nr:PP2C family protein-serine/threonine phosphatase [Tepidisphaeraceae bacterium]